MTNQQANNVLQPKKLEYLGTRMKALIDEELSRPFGPPAQLSAFRRITTEGHKDHMSQRKTPNAKRKTQNILRAALPPPPPHF